MVIDEDRMREILAQVANEQGYFLVGSREPLPMGSVYHSLNPGPLQPNIAQSY